MDRMNELRQQWEARYESGDTPWNSGQTPPEVSSMLSSGQLPPKARAIDLGCGTGTNLITLARWGLNVIGIELSERALSQAEQRLRDIDASVRRRTALVQGDVAHLPLTAFGASYIVDIGCLHGVPPALRPAYAEGVIDNLSSGGYYHLFAFDQSGNADAKPPWRGLDEDEVETLFTPALSIVQITHGNPDHHPCRWYLLQKSDAGKTKETE